MRVVFFLIFLKFTSAVEQWKVVDVDRTVDISSQIVKITAELTLENGGASHATSVDIILSEDEDNHLSYISAQETGNKGKLKISKQGVVREGFQIYKIELLKSVNQGGQLKMKLDYRLTGILGPLPSKIEQHENQFVVYQGTVLFPSAYTVVKERTIVRTGTGKIISATALAPSKQESDRVIYGPYYNSPPFNTKIIKIHYENNGPFVVATTVERRIEISHWGNIAVEDYIELVHKGAQLKGSFSRLDYQMDRRGRRQPALQYFTTILPASAKDIYYRDEIGNISTSAVRVRADSVDVEIKPRFPLFGGWKTSYVIGYNVPSYNYLYNKGNEYILKMRVLDHIFDNIVVEKLTTRIILPEMVKKIKLYTPFTMERRPDESHPTYLDTTGRTVVVLQKDNLVGEHIQTLTLSYEFEFTNMIREPLLSTAFFFLLFMVIIIYVRFDFTIVIDPKREARERIQGKVATLTLSVDRKQKLFSQLIDNVNGYKTSRDVNVLQNAKRTLEAGRQEANEKLSSDLNGLKLDSLIAFDKAQELLKYDKPVVDAVDGYIASVQKIQQKSASTEDFNFAQKVTEARIRAESILAAI